MPTEMPRTQHAFVCPFNWVSVTESKAARCLTKRRRASQHRRRYAQHICILNAAADEPQINFGARLVGDAILLAAVLWTWKSSSGGQNQESDIVSLDDVKLLSPRSRQEVVDLVVDKAGLSHDRRDAVLAGTDCLFGNVLAGLEELDPTILPVVSEIRWAVSVDPAVVLNIEDELIANFKETAVESVVSGDSDSSLVASRSPPVLLQYALDKGSLAQNPAIWGETTEEEKLIVARLLSQAVEVYLQIMAKLAKDQIRSRVSASITANIISELDGVLDNVSDSPETPQPLLADLREKLPSVIGQTLENDRDFQLLLNMGMSKVSTARALLSGTEGQDRILMSGPDLSFFEPGRVAQLLRMTADLLYSSDGVVWTSATTESSPNSLGNKPEDYERTDFASGTAMPREEVPKPEEPLLPPGIVKNGIPSTATILARRARYTEKNLSQTKTDTNGSTGMKPSARMALSKVLRSRIAVLFRAARWLFLSFPIFLVRLIEAAAVNTILKKPWRDNRDGDP